MSSARPSRWLLTLLASLMAGPIARALVSFDDSRDHVFVTGTIGVAHDSNIYANDQQIGDFLYTAGLLTEYNRRAGWITVNGTIGLQAGHFARHSKEDYLNPKARLELVKAGGRTTGSLLATVERVSIADPTVNVRDVSWNYGATVAAKYPVIERYSVAGSLGYSLVDYIGNPDYIDLRAYTAAADLAYQLRSDRDLLLGYRIRESDTAAGHSSTDHAATVGVSGRIIDGFTGSVRAGYEVRVPHGGTDPVYSSWTSTAAVTRTVNKRLSITAQLTKDFSYSPNDISTDTTSATLDTQYIFSSHWEVFANAGTGGIRFLGRAGVDPATGRNRRDTFLNGGAGIAYLWHEHYKLSLAYSWMENWSVLHYADFVRQGWSLALTGRW